jgi:EAL domain-containing protein (putative c-di-GMP-specific phosphodiesterase class I)/ABC-type amino acid transport substrate-binding protein/GGDEF domain-containing protein
MHFRSRLPCAAFWWAILFLYADPVAAQSIKVAGDRGYPPYHYLAQDGAAAGFDVEVIRELTRQLGYTVEFQLGDWEEAQAKLESGDVDIIPMFISERRRERFLFSTPFLIREHLVFGRRESPEVNSIEDLRGRLVAVQAGGLAAAALAELGFDNVLALDNEPGTLKAVADGRAEYALAPMFIGYHALREYRIADIVALSPPLLAAEYAFAVSMARPQLVSQLNLALGELRRSGRFDELYRQHLEALYTPPRTLMMTLREGRWIIAPLLLVALVALYLMTAAGGRARRNIQLARKHLHGMYAERRARERVESRVEYLAYHDPLTTLPNLNAFRRELASTLEQPLYQKGRLAVAIFDVLDLEIIRQIAGYTIANRWLQSLAGRFRQRAGFAYAAVHGHGTFIFILKHIDNSEDARKQIEQIGEIIRERVDIDQVQLEGRFRCGWALYPDHCDNADTLLHAAEMARDNTYERDKRILCYDRKLEPDPRNLTLMADLREAIINDRLDWAFQPKLDLLKGTVVGAEMLVRWQHPVYGAIPPNLFIPFAEKTGVINDLTRHLLVKALRHCREWASVGHDLQLAVNVSGNDLADRRIIDTLLDRVGEFGPLLILEVTETAILRDIHACLRNIQRLRERGISIALDDFGTGFSSLTYLKQLNPDKLKIDQSFIKDMQQSKEDMAIVRASIELSHELDTRVTAEGIEDPSVQRLLVDLNCDIGQGYGIARPMPYHDFMQFYLARTAN